MPHAERTIVINRSPDEVFRFFTTPANDASWRTGVKEISAEGPVAVGTKVHQVVAGPGGRSIAADIQVTAYEPPTRYGFKAIAGPARPVGVPSRSRSSFSARGWRSTWPSCAMSLHGPRFSRRSRP